MTHLRQIATVVLLVAFVGVSHSEAGQVSFACGGTGGNGYPQCGGLCCSAPTCVLLHPICMAIDGCCACVIGSQVNPQCGECGNGIIEAPEECDDGAANGTMDSCCAVDCTIRPAGELCRPATNACDAAESCDGVSDSCPADMAMPDGTLCDDGNACTVQDQCLAGTCTGAGVCGDGVLQTECGEQCDDGNRIDGDGCDSNCRIEASPTPTVSPQATPTPLGCASSPRSDCRLPLVPGNTPLILSVGTTSAKNELRWGWRKGATETSVDFGNPLNGTGYDVCVYDGSDQLLLDAAAPASGTCVARPCWRSINDGVRYINRDLSPDGVLALQLVVGSDGSAKIKCKAKGANLVLPALPIHNLPLVFQLVNSDGQCWGATYGGTLKNLPNEFKARGD
jgi:cysteine-rich repeat protein